MSETSVKTSKNPQSLKEGRALVCRSQTDAMACDLVLVTKRPSGKSMVLTAGTSG